MVNRFILTPNIKSEILYKNSYPLKWHKALSQLAKKYGAKYSYLKDKTITGGYSRVEQKIYLGSYSYEKVGSVELCKTFSHELAHRIQHQIINKHRGRNIVKPIFTKMSECLKYERMAERVANFICSEYFSNICQWNHREFSTYIKKSDISYLTEHWSYTAYNIENDL